MAGDWIKWTKGFASKPEVLQIAGILDLHPYHVAAGLMVLYEWCDSNIADSCDDGHRNAIVTVGALHPRALDALTGIENLGDALQQVGWFKAETGHWVFPNYFRHNGQTSKTRALTSERAHKHRNAHSVTNVTPTPLPEKRREEYKIQNTSCSGRTRKSGPTRTPISLNRSTWNWEGITPEDRRIWSDANPAVNLDKELAAMVAWCRSNGARGQKRNWPAFITRWLAKAQDRGGPNAGDNSKAVRAVPHDIPEDCR